MRRHEEISEERARSPERLLRRSSPAGRTRPQVDDIMRKHSPDRKRESVDDILRRISPERQQTTTTTTTSSVERHSPAGSRRPSTESASTRMSRLDRSAAAEERNKAVNERIKSVEEFIRKRSPERPSSSASRGECEHSPSSSRHASRHASPEPQRPAIPSGRRTPVERERDLETRLSSVNKFIRSHSPDEADRGSRAGSRPASPKRESIEDILRRHSPERSETTTTTTTSSSVTRKSSPERSSRFGSEQSSTEQTSTAPAYEGSFL